MHPFLRVIFPNSITGAHRRAIGRGRLTGRRGERVGRSSSGFGTLASRRRRMTDLLDRITINPNQCSGRPCIRGMRIRVTDVLELLAAGEGQAEILEAYPSLEADD